MGAGAGWGRGGVVGWCRVGCRGRMGAGSTLAEGAAAAAQAAAPPPTAAPPRRPCAAARHALTGVGAPLLDLEHGLHVGDARLAQVGGGVVGGHDAKAQRLQVARNGHGCGVGWQGGVQRQQPVGGRLGWAVRQRQQQDSARLPLHSTTPGTTPSTHTHQQQRQPPTHAPASLYLSIIVMNTLPPVGRRCPAAMAALAYALPKVTSMPMTCW